MRTWDDGATIHITLGSAETWSEHLSTRPYPDDTVASIVEVIVAAAALSKMRPGVPSGWVGAICMFRELTNSKYIINRWAPIL